MYGWESSPKTGLVDTGGSLRQPGGQGGLLDGQLLRDSCLRIPQTLCQAGSAGGWDRLWGAWNAGNPITTPVPCFGRGGRIRCWEGCDLENLDGMMELLPLFPFGAGARISPSNDSSSGGSSLDGMGMIAQLPRPGSEVERFRPTWSSGGWRAPRHLFDGIASDPSQPRKSPVFLRECSDTFNFPPHPPS
jgi:hypothetical protein